MNLPSKLEKRVWSSLWISDFGESGLNNSKDDVVETDVTMPYIKLLSKGKSGIKDIKPAPRLST